MNDDRNRQIITGVIGILSIIIALVSLYLESGLQIFGQDLWANISAFVMGGITILVFATLFGIAVGKLSSKEFSELVHRIIEPITNIKAPKPIYPQSEEDNIAVIEALTQARNGIISPKELAKVVETWVNTGRLRAEVAAESLFEFNYVLVLNADGTYTALQTSRAKETTKPTTAKQGRNRLSSLLAEMATNFEIPYIVDADGMNVTVGIPASGRMIMAKYAFDKLSNSYEVGAVIGKVDDVDLRSVEEKILRGKPIKGIMERIIDNRKVVLGSRDGLSGKSASEIKKYFMEDIAQIAAAHARFEKSK
ncbi:MAG: hypothetical protein ACOYZ8_08005 [Chloroflexota bacterium]